MMHDGLVYAHTIQVQHKFNTGSIIYKKMRSLTILMLLVGSIHGFSPPHCNTRWSTITSSGGRLLQLHRPSSASTKSATAASASTGTTQVEPKEIVKVFGRLAEKYIMLDDSGGMCCYSACSDCEYRLPGGGYKMADQSASRPKWIATYDERKFEAQGKEHVTRWSTEIFLTNEDNNNNNNNNDDATPVLAVTKERFVEAVIKMKFTPPLGGPYTSASAATIEDPAAVEKLWDILAGEKEKLTKHRMMKQLKEISKGEEGVTWAMFEEAFRTNEE